jgi:alpha-beta hydrolase superfamily lysophospholipase
VVGRIAENCLYGTAQILASVPSALFLDIVFLSAPPWDVEPWNTIARDNTPGGSTIDVPVLLVQGGADEIVAPTVTDHFADMLCANGEAVEYKLYDGIGHLDTGHAAVPDVVTWVADRFAGVTAPTTCQE